MKKIPVMLVDDEALVTDDLKSIIDWESLGFTIVATAKNGQQALKKYREFSPKIIFTDIQMPIMDGVRLAEELRKGAEQPIIIFLTAYSDFGYAKQAFQFGIDDYLLKNEVSEELIHKKLAELKKRIKAAEKTNALLNKELLANLLKQTDVPLPAELAKCGRKAYYCILEEDGPCPFLIHMQFHPLKAEELEKDVLFQMQDLSIDVFAEIKDGLYVIGFSLALQTLAEWPTANLERHLRKLIEALKINRDKSFTAMLFAKPYTLLEFRNEYSRAIENLQVKYFSGCGRIYLYKGDSLQYNHEKASFDVNQMYAALHSLNLQATQRMIQEKYETVLKGKQYYELVSVSNLLYLILQHILDTEILTKEKLDISIETNCNLWFSAKSIQAWMLEKYAQAIQRLRSGEWQSLSNVVKRTVELIQSKFNEDSLKIELLADHAHLSTSRLSVLFKKEMGCTINEYLTSFRIAQAQLLLGEGTYKVYEVAERVGYGSSQYFSQIFYQQVGVTPKDYYNWVQHHEK